MRADGHTDAFELISWQLNSQRSNTLWTNQWRAHNFPVRWACVCFPSWSLSCSTDVSLDYKRKTCSLTSELTSFPWTINETQTAKCRVVFLHSNCELLTRTWAAVTAAQTVRIEDIMLTVKHLRVNELNEQLQAWCDTTGPALKYPQCSAAWWWIETFQSAADFHCVCVCVCDWTYWFLLPI